MKKPVLLIAVCVGLVGIATVPAPGVDFIRGDANGDGKVSLADALFIYRYLFDRGPAPECLSAADANNSTGSEGDTGDWSIDVADIAAIHSHLIRGYVFPEPFPEPGPDPTPDPVLDIVGMPPRAPCEVYGNGSVLEDPLARLVVQDAVAPGGDAGRVTIPIALGTSTDLGGWLGNIRIQGDVLLNAAASPADLSGVDPQFWTIAAMDGAVLVFWSFVPLEGTPLPAGQDLQVLEIEACLREGTPAGEYSLTLELGELADYVTGRSVEPELVSGTLTVLEDVTASESCIEEPPALPPLNAVYRLRGTRAPPGGVAEVPFSIRADALVAGYSFSVDFDERVLEAVEVEEVWSRPDGEEFSFAVYEFNNDNDFPGSAGVDEGFVLGAVVFDWQEAVGLPPDVETDVLRLRFAVDPEAQSGSTDLTFLAGGQGSGEPVPNKLTANGEIYFPELATTFVFIGSTVDILPDILVFIRGDSNGDGAVDTSDALATLGYLFQGADPVHCLDAADVNDDGALDISDAIGELQHLFLGGPPPPAPYPEAGEDPTEDAMGCLYGPS